MTTVSPGAVRPSTVSLRALFPDARFLHCADLIASDLTERSQDCQPGWIFAAIPGTKAEGARFISQALEKGAAGLLVDREMPETAVPQCVVPDVRSAFARLCGAVYGSPSRRLQIAGVTGTNGKTTVTWMIRAILRQANQHCGLLGTIEYDDGSQTESSSLTTPDSKTFVTWLGRVADRGTQHAAVELSSHALHQNRVAGTELAAAVITNITQDHFDYHRNFENYQAAKARIVELLRPDGVLILNRDDPGSRAVGTRMPAEIRIQSFSLLDAADVTGRRISESLEGSRFRLSVRGETELIDSPLIGRHNVENCLAAAAACSALGVSLPHIAEGLRSFHGAPGRLERISCGQHFDVFVDYAHTDDALRRSLECLRSVTPGRVLCMFGAGGDRDRLKRPLLGRAAQLADVSIVTSDNPRSEVPARIADDIVAGYSADGPQPVIELDRAQAIRKALRLARPGDSVLIAGKGHENEQIFRDHRIPFDDRRETRQALVEILAQQSPTQRKGA